jgi:hypothetical protein
LALWSRTQASVALSSAEASFYAIATGITEAELAQHLWEEFSGMTLNIRILSDSSAARAAEQLVFTE